MTILALDLGDASIGIAVSDPTATFALPLCTIPRKSKAFVIDTLKKVAEERSVQK